MPDLTVAPVARPPYVPETDFYSGDLAQMLGLQRDFRETDDFAQILKDPRLGRPGAKGSSDGA